MNVCSIQEVSHISWGSDTQLGNKGRIWSCRVGGSLYWKNALSHEQGLLSGNWHFKQTWPYHILKWEVSGKIIFSYFKVVEIWLSIITRKCSIAAESHIRSHHHVSFNTYFCKPIAITLNVILYEFIVSRVYGHTISLYPSEYINSETMSHIIIFVMKQINLQLFVWNVHHNYCPFNMHIISIIGLYMLYSRIYKERIVLSVAWVS